MGGTIGLTFSTLLLGSPNRNSGVEAMADQIAMAGYHRLDCPAGLALQKRSR
ncbi:MAG: hypothetical protein ACREDC_07420 [Bradyrhizobium sp.]